MIYSDIHSPFPASCLGFKFFNNLIENGGGLLKCGGGMIADFFRCSERCFSSGFFVKAVFCAN